MKTKCSNYTSHKFKDQSRNICHVLASGKWTVELNDHEFIEWLENKSEDHLSDWFVEKRQHHQLIFATKKDAEHFLEKYFQREFDIQQDRLNNF